MEDGRNTKIANYILKLRKAFPDGTVFGRSDMMKEIALKPSRASEFLKELEEQRVIEAVTGHGKGKYCFISGNSEAGKEAGKEAGGEAGREAGKEAGREAGKEAGRDDRGAKPAGMKAEEEKKEASRVAVKKEAVSSEIKVAGKKEDEANSSLRKPFSGYKVTEELPVWLL